MSNSRGIDIYNGSGTVDFQTAKNAGLKVCIARCGYGADQTDQDDEQFQRNYDQCKALGIPLGSYFYTYALTVAGTESEKAHLKRLLAGKSFELPVFVDIEDADGYRERHGGIPDAQTNTDIVKALCECIKTLGFEPGYYCNKDWVENHLLTDQLPYAFYYARPGVAQPDKPCYLWQDQIGSTGGHFPGIKDNSPGSCDTDILMADLPEKAPQPAAPVTPPAPAVPETYTVKDGDTLSGIAVKFNTTVSALAALNGIQNVNLIHTGDVLRLTNSSAPSAPISTASGDANVRAAQQFYNARGAGLVTDGIWGPATRKAAVASVQRGCNQAYGSGLAVDGIFGDKTLGAIRTLRNGDDNSSVWSLQAALMAHGYSVGGIDGKFGSNTESAVKAFQNAAGLKADGLTGRLTFAALCK